MNLRRKACPSQKPDPELQVYYMSYRLEARKIKVAKKISADIQIAFVPVLVNNSPTYLLLNDTTF